MVVPLTDVGMIREETGLRVNQEFYLQHAQRDQMGTSCKPEARRIGLSVCYQRTYDI